MNIYSAYRIQEFSRLTDGKAGSDNEELPAIYPILTAVACVTTFVIGAFCGVVVVLSVYGPLPL